MDFLFESLLLDEDLVESAYSSIADDRLESELQAYRSWVLTNTALIAGAARGGPNDLAAFFGPSAGLGSAGDPVATLRRSAMYFDRAVMDDPLFALTRPLPHGAAAMAAFHGHSDPTRLDRIAIAQAAHRIRTLSPLIGVDFLRLAPLGLAHEPPVEVPVYLSGVPMPEGVPDAVRHWLQAKVQVANAFPLEDGEWASGSGPLDVGRAIFVTFPDYDGGMLFHLTPSRAQDINEPERSFLLKMWKTLEPPSAEAFAAWVTQSVNSFSARVVQGLSIDMRNAAAAEAMYITDSEFLADLLMQGSEPHVDAEVANLALNLELPFLDGVGIDAIARVRATEPTAFTAYREHLQSNLLHLRHETDTRLVQLGLEDLAYELTRVQIPAIDREVRRLRQQMAIGAATGLASLATLAPTSGLSLATLIAGIGHGVQSFVEYRQKLMNRPAYVLWRITRAAS